MLTLKEPIKLNIADGLGSAADESFFERITGNYDIMSAQITPKDLLFFLSAPPELPEDLGGMTTFAVQNNISSSRAVTMDVVNNVINRILLSDTSSFTYQDQVYIDTVLNKLGITDVSLFMKQVQKLSSQHSDLHQLLRLYRQELSLQSSSALPDEQPRAAGEKAAATEGSAGPAPRYYLHSEIYNRLDTKSIYDVVNAFQQEQSHYFGSFQRNELKTSEQLNISSLLELNDMRRQLLKNEQLGLTYAVNHFELGDLLPPPASEEEVLSQAAAAALVSTVEHVLVSQLRRSDSSSLWLRLENSLSETVENTISRFQSYHSGDTIYLSPEADMSIDVKNTYETEINALRELVTLHSRFPMADSELLREMIFREQLSISALQAPFSAEALVHPAQPELEDEIIAPVSESVFQDMSRHINNEISGSETFNIDSSSTEFRLSEEQRRGAEDALAESVPPKMSLSHPENTEDALPESPAEERGEEGQSSSFTSRETDIIKETLSAHKTELESLKERELQSLSSPEANSELPREIVFKEQQNIPAPQAPFSAEALVHPAQPELESEIIAPVSESVFQDMSRHINNDISGSETFNIDSSSTEFRLSEELRRRAEERLAESVPTKMSLAHPQTGEEALPEPPVEERGEEGQSTSFTSRETNIIKETLSAHRTELESLKERELQSLSSPEANPELPREMIYAQPPLSRGSEQSESEEDPGKLGSTSDTQTLRERSSQIISQEMSRFLKSERSSAETFNIDNSSAEYLLLQEEQQRQSAEAPSDEALTPVSFSHPISDAEAPTELLAQEVAELNRQNRERFQQIQSVRAMKIGESVPTPDKARIMSDALRSLQSPEAVLREALGENPAELEHRAQTLPPEAAAYLSGADEATRNLLQSVMLYERDPAAAAKAGALREANLGELNAALTIHPPRAAEVISEARRLERETVHLTERAETILEKYGDAGSSRILPQSAPSAMPKAPIIHRQEQSTLPDELIERLEQQRSTQRITSESTDVVSKQNVHETIQNDVSTQVVTQTTEDITQLVNRAISKQMSTISDKVYHQMEKRLQTERSRRGRF